MSTLKRASKYYWLRVLTIMLLVVLILPSGTVFAQGSSPYAKKSSPGSVQTPSSIAGDNLTQVSGNLLQDPGFESSFGSTLYWGQSSVVFTSNSPLCTVAGCGNGNGTAGPRSGSVWAWFGGVFPESEDAAVWQSLTIPQSCTATLQFYFWIGYADPGSGQDDSFRAMVDDTPVFTSNATEISQYSSYTLVTVNLGAYANGAPHTIKFEGITTNQLVTFNLDDISLVVGGDKCIKGNAGVAGATLSYTDATPKTILSRSDGSYTLPVSTNWSGTVTPSHPCYSFTPTSKTYNNVVADLTGENYTAAFNNAAVCAVTIGVFRPSNGVLFLKNSNTSGFADMALNYGLSGDYPVVGDWDNNGTDTIGVYRGSTFYLRNSNTVGFADITVSFGQPGDQPIAGDWNGDGTDTIGIYRPSTGQFLLRNSNTAGFADISFYLGNVGDIGIAGDWDGNGTDTVGVFRPSNGVIFLKNTNATGFADVALNYGLAGDKPVVGDWDNNGTTTIGIYRNGRFYLRNSNTNGFANITLDLGNIGDMPIAGNWDGKP